MINKRFRKFLPVVIDVETGGLHPGRDALLEVACVFLDMNDDNIFITKNIHHHIDPFEGANIEQKALEFNKIDPNHPFRFAISESDALKDIFKSIQEEVDKAKCQKAVLVGHNAWFDLSFINAAARRCKQKSPLHSFTSFDTATLGAAVYGHTVLAQILKLANIPYNPEEAHGALYDATITAELFCKIINSINN